MRQILVAGNWKLNGSLDSIKTLVSGITAGAGDAGNTRIAVCPPFVYIPVVADLLCSLRLHTELSMRAKGLLMMRESGFHDKAGEETRAKLEEMKYLERSIGTTGKLAVKPFLRMSQEDLWQFYMLSA